MTPEEHPRYFLGYLNDCKPSPDEKTARTVLKNAACVGFGVGKEDAWSQVILARQLSAAVMRAQKPGFTWPKVAVLIGPQGCGKTRALRALFPEPDVTVADEFDFDWTDYCIAEVLKRKAAARFVLNETRFDKARVVKIATRSADTFRPPYQSHVRRYPRTAVFFGESNFSGALEEWSWADALHPVQIHHQAKPGFLRKNRDEIWGAVRTLTDRIQSVSESQTEKLLSGEAATGPELMTLDGPIIQLLQEAIRKDRIRIEQLEERLSALEARPVDARV